MTKLLDAWFKLDLLVLDSDFNDELIECLEDETGETLLSYIFSPDENDAAGIAASLKMTDDELAAETNDFIAKLTNVANWGVDTLFAAGRIGELLPNLKTFLEQDKSLRLSFQKSEAIALVNSYVHDTPAFLNLLDTVIGSFLIVKTLETLMPDFVMDETLLLANTNRESR